jgi:hypothetical protein
MRGVARLVSFVYFLAVAIPTLAGFASTEVFLPAVGRVTGQGGAQFYTTVWATNLTGAPETFTFQFLKQGQANGSPASFQDTLAPGQTKVYENVIQSRLGLASAIGAARVTSTGEIFLSERIFNQAPGADLGNTEGLFFAGVPKTFSISAGQSASIQGLNQGGSENFRYNFALVETGGGSTTVNVQVFDGGGVLLGQKSFPLLPYEQLQPNVADVVPGFSSINARITATVTSGTGSVLLAGAQLANESQDSSGFEMSFRDDLLGGGTAGVSSLNGLAGALTIAHGANTTVNINGKTITIDAVAGSGTGLTAVAHDNSLAGSGTVPAPLGIAIGQVVRSLNGLHDNLTLAAGSNVTLTPSGSTITIAASGGGGLTLPFSGSADSAESAFSITNTHPSSLAVGIDGTGRIGVSGKGAEAGVLGLSPPDSLVDITDNVGVYGSSSGGYGIYGVSQTGFGVHGESASGIAGVEGVGYASIAGVEGVGYSSSASSYAVYGHAYGNGAGVFGEAEHGAGVVGSSHGGTYGVFAYGGFGGTGPKYFVEPHPSDPTKEIRYVCLEGRESGTYFRGTGKIVNGFASVEVPEDFRMVTSDKGLSVQLTPVGDFASMVVKSYGLDRIVVQANRDVEFFYMINGIRKAFENHQPISENRDFIPGSADDTRLVASLPVESVRRLKANGTLKEDGSINLETAHRLGWDQTESWKRAETATRR